MEVESIKVEWVILGDYADIVGGKLFLQGGGWERLTVNTEFPVKRMIGIATSVMIPWGETNKPANLEVEVQTADGNRVIKGTSEVKVGRPPDHPPGMPVRRMSASNLVLELKSAGSYVIVSKLNGKEATRTPFYIIPGPLLAMKQQQQQAEQQGSGDDQPAAE